MSHRVAQQDRVRLGKVAVVEHEHELAAIGVETLNRMRNARWKKPKVVFLYVGDKTLAVRVDRCDPRGPVKQDGPFGGRMPMQLPDAAGGEPHVYTRHGLGHGKLSNRHLARPPALIGPLI